MDERDIRLLGAHIAERHNRFQVYRLTAWGLGKRSSWGRVLWKGGRP